MPWGIDLLTGNPQFVANKGDKGDQGDPGVDGDKHYTENFTNQATLNITHNLNKKPAVTVVDTAGDEIEGEVTHNTIDDLTIVFSASFSGSVILN